MEEEVKEQETSHETASTNEIVESENNDEVVKEDVSVETTNESIFESLNIIVNKLDILSKELKEYSEQRNAIAVESGEVINDKNSNSVVIDKIEDIPSVDDLDLTLSKRED